MAKLIINNQDAELEQQEYANFHGTSVFTTMRSHKKQAMLWERHWQRLSLHARFFDFKMPQEDLILDIINQNLANNNLEQKIRIIISPTAWALTFEDIEKPDSQIYDGVSVCISSFQTHPQFAGIKTSNSLPYILALKEARAHNFFEALLLDNEGYVSDGARTSIMLYDGHSLDSLLGGLDGCMRQEVLAYAQSLGVSVRHVRKRPSRLHGQLLLANSILGIVPVGAIAWDLVKHLVDFYRMDEL